MLTRIAWLCVGILLGALVFAPNADAAITTFERDPAGNIPFTTPYNVTTIVDDYSDTCAYYADFIRSASDDVKYEVGFGLTSSLETSLTFDATVLEGNPSFAPGNDQYFIRVYNDTPFVGLPDDNDFPVYLATCGQTRADEYFQFQEGTTPTSTPTSTDQISAPYIPSLTALLFFCSFWTTLFIMLWKRN